MCHVIKMKQLFTVLVDRRQKTPMWNERTAPEIAKEVIARAVGRAELGLQVTLYLD